MNRNSDDGMGWVIYAGLGGAVAVLLVIIAAAMWVL